jgi:cyclophilin family peptidyl-prolyl cis-trans isomerase
MSRKSSRKRYVPPSVQARQQRKLAEAKAAAARRQWWIGGVVVALLIIAAVVLWFTIGPGGSATPPSPTLLPTPTPRPTLLPTPTPRPTPTLVDESSVERNDMYDASPEMQIDPGKTYVATISTEKGDIVVRLDAGAAPQTVNNFVFLAREGFYDGLTFHRVEPGFVIQGGDPLGDGTGGPGYTVPAEIGLPHVEGAIAMARRSDAVNPERASSGSQFYITLAPTPQLDGAYTVFGQVVEGMDVVQAIGVGDVIQSISIIEE